MTNTQIVATKNKIKNFETMIKNTTNQNTIEFYKKQIETQKNKLKEIEKK
jgi:hypothetical protein